MYHLYLIERSENNFSLFDYRTKSKKNHSRFHIFLFPEYTCSKKHFFSKPTLVTITYLNIPGSTSGGEQMKINFFNSLKLRGFDTICLLNANDTDIFDFIQNFPHGATGLQSLILRCCNISDRGLEAIMEFLQGLYKLEIAGCNEITEQGLWSSLHPRLASLTINDCINVADECVCAVTQLLPALYEFNLQAYHVTDSALSYFSPKQTGTLNILRLQSCWEITNHGIVNIGMYICTTSFATA